MTKWYVFMHDHHTHISVVPIINGRLFCYMRNAITMLLIITISWVALVSLGEISYINCWWQLHTLTSWALLIFSTIFAFRRNCWNCNIWFSLLCCWLHSSWRVSLSWIRSDRSRIYPNEIEQVAPVNWVMTNMQLHVTHRWYVSNEWAKNHRTSHSCNLTRH